MLTGWSDGGHGRLRASHADRRAVSSLPRAARCEGRLDAAAFGLRGDAVASVETRADLVATGPLTDEVARVLWDSPLWPLRGPTCCSMTAARSCRTPAGCGTGRLTGFQAEQYARYGPRPYGYPTG